MNKLKLLFTVVIVFAFTIPLLPQSENFPTSLHKTRQGKITWYSTVEHGGSGGFETLTGVPIDELGCVGCHPGDNLDANGDPYPEPYPGMDCVDCHATNNPDPPMPGTLDEQQCFDCHGREGTIVTLGISDVHRDAGMKCWDCHGTTDMHGDGNQYTSMLDEGAIAADCQQAGCHESIPSNAEHTQHSANIHCSSCHMQTALACYNCHFESMVQSHIKRAKQKITDFVILVNREKDGKVHPATFQSLSYQGHSWIALAPGYAHTITGTGARTCSDCHENFGGQIAAIEDYNDDGVMQFASWNDADSTLSWLHGVVPLPKDYLYSFKMDFITYNGDPSDPPGPSKNWSFVKSEADGFQIRGGTALTMEQMAKIGFDTTLVGVEEDINTVPNKFKLEQNYPNPFNPTTMIEYAIPERSNVQLKVYDALGNLIQTLVDGEKEAGTYKMEFNGANLASGVYFYQLTAKNFVSTKKLVLMR